MGRFFKHMITKENIKKLAEEHVKEFNGFVVDILVSPANKVVVEIDSHEGVTLKQCESLNRYLNHELDNEANEFELTVSSPGLEKPYRVLQQYVKNVGRRVNVKLNNGSVIEGKLVKAGGEEIEIEHTAKEKVEGKSKRELVTRTDAIKLTDIKETKTIISFK